MICAVLAAVFVQAPALGGAWVHWQTWRPIVTSATGEPALTRFALPIATYGAAQQDLADIRVVDEAGHEVPYAMETPGPRYNAVTSEAALSDTGFVPGKYTQTVGDVGRGGALHNELTLVIPESESDFFTWVAVDASDDKQTWRIIRERAPVFRFRADELQGQQTVTFPQTSARWLRVRVLDGSKAFPIDGVTVSHIVEAPVELQSLAEPVTLSPQSPEHKSWWDADLGVKDVPVTLVSFGATQSAFHRPVSVSASDDGMTWTEVAQGDIYRDSGYERLAVDVTGGRGRYWRITVYNRNDTPIDGLSVHLSTTPEYIVFRQTPGHSYFLLYGNARASAPQYDFASVTSRAQLAGATVVAAGPENKNEAYQSPLPWTERNGWVMWAALVLAVVVVGALAISTMRQPPENEKAS